MHIEKSGGELRELDMVALLGFELLFRPRDGWAKDFIRYLEKHLENLEQEIVTCEMKNTLLKRNIPAELRSSKFDEGPAIVTRGLVDREALGTLLLHVAAEGIESSAILFFDQRAQVMPTNGTLT
jgi:hypothetical protein